MKLLSSLVASALLLSAAALPAAAQATGDDAQSGSAKPYPLSIGDPAPPLAIQTWVKGTPLEAFPAGKVTVVEFWATWCGPCIAGMPHMSEVQAKYADKGVQVIGVDIWDEPKNVAPFMANTIKVHKKTGDEVMQYTVAIEKKDDPKNVRMGVMAKKWMQAAGRTGIPCAFVVDGQGRVAWIGHPARIDDPLAQIVAGTWDLKAEAASYAKTMATQAKIQSYFQLFQAKEFDKAYAVGRDLVKHELADNAAQLNQIAWMIVDPESTPALADLDLALTAATRAVELTKAKDPGILDTLAVVYHAKGDLKQAVAQERAALALAKGTRMETDIQKRLDAYEAESQGAGTH